MSVIESAQAVIIGAVCLLILANVLGALNPSLETQLGNTAVHPNGELALTVIALFVVVFAINILLAIFQKYEEPPNRGFMG